MPIRSVLATLLASVLIVPLSAGPAEAAPAVRFSSVQYDSPGTDTGSNTSLNGEWIKVTNYSSSAKSLSGWTIRDITGYTYRFPQGYRLGAGKTVQLHTGAGGNTASDRYWGRGSYVWNNTGDKATLKSGSGTVVHTCKWEDGDGNKAC